MHWIQAIIGPAEVLMEARSQIPSAVVCPLRHRLALIPLTGEVIAELEKWASSPEPALSPHSGEMAPGLPEFAKELSSKSWTMYAATYIHGGTGGQDALVWIDGEMVLNIGDDEENMSRWPDSPISRALRRAGIVAEEGLDEFDAIGLGLHRSNESWAEAHVKPSQA